MLSKEADIGQGVGENEPWLKGPFTSSFPRLMTGTRAKRNAQPPRYSTQNGEDGRGRIP